MVIAWLISAFRNEEEHENHCTSSYEFDSQLCTLEVEACWGMVFLIEKITSNSDGRLNEAEIFWAM